MLKMNTVIHVSYFMFSEMEKNTNNVLTSKATFCNIYSVFDLDLLAFI